MVFFSSLNIFETANLEPLPRKSTSGLPQGQFLETHFLFFEYGHNFLFLYIFHKFLLKTFKKVYVVTLELDSLQAQDLLPFYLMIFSLWSPYTLSLLAT